MAQTEIKIVWSPTPKAEQGWHNGHQARATEKLRRNRTQGITQGVPAYFRQLILLLAPLLSASASASLCQIRHEQFREHPPFPPGVILGRSRKSAEQASISSKYRE